MIKNRKIILKFLNKNYPKSYSFDELKSICKIDDNLFEEHLQKLVKDNLIKEEWCIEDIKDDIEYAYYYKSTLDGTEYFKNQRNQFFNDFFKSTAYPLIVALVSSIITAIVTTYVLRPTYNDICNYCSTKEIGDISK